MAEIGKTKKNGVHRLALSDEDKHARELLISWLKELQLDIKIDDFGNIFARKEGAIPGLPPVVCGSHLDTVPYGGRFDGTLGVLAALEVVSSIMDHNIEHEYPIVIAMFTNEEGARYTKPMLGSGAITGIFQKEFVYQLKDDEGKEFITELARIGFLGEKENRLKDIKSFIELHIEQGPVLMEKERTIGIVKGIQGISWQQVMLTGQADHAGPTPMKSRKDALITAMKIINKIHKWVSNLEDDTSVTFGKLAVSPNTINVVPGNVSFSIDLRHPDRKKLYQRIDKVKEIILNIASYEDVAEQIEEVTFIEPVLFSERLVNNLEEICQEKGYSYYTMFSGAGHDAMYMNNIGEAVMIFVPSIDGKSHCEEEDTTWPDIYQGVDILYRLICRESVENKDNKKSKTIIV